MASLSLSGHVFDADGTPSANTSLSLNALDYSQSIATNGGIHLTDTTTDTNGHFSIATTGCCIAELTMLRALAAVNGGYVELEVWGATADGGLILNDFPVQLLSSVSDDSVAFAPQTASPTVSHIKLQAGRGLVETVATAGDPGPFANDDPDPAIGVSDPSSAITTYDGSQLQKQNKDSSEPAFDGPQDFPDGPLTSCSRNGGQLYWLDGPNGGKPDIDRYVPVQGYMTEQNSHFHYNETWSDGTEMGAAITGQYGYFGGGLTYSENRDHSMGVNVPKFNWEEGGVRVQWQYHMLRALCYGSNTHPANWWMNAWKWTPWSFAGGADTEEISWGFYCAGHYVSRLPASASTWVSQGVSDTYSRMYSIAGISLDSRQTSGTERKLTWYADADHEAKFCGNDSYMSSAHKVEEIPD